MNNSLAYSPATWLDQFFTDFDKAFVGNNKVTGSPVTGNPGSSNAVTFSPAVDIVEEKEDYVLRAELPGVAKENIKLEVKENRLTLSGKKDSSHEARAGEYRYVESKFGTFSRAFELPRNVSAEAIKAEHQNGVLTLRIPKAKEALSRSIAIQ